MVRCAFRTSSGILRAPARPSSDVEGVNRNPQRHAGPWTDRQPPAVGADLCDSHRRRRQSRYGRVGCRSIRAGSRTVVCPGADRACRCRGDQRRVRVDRPRARGAVDAEHQHADRCPRAGCRGRPEAPYRLLRGGTIDGPASGGLVVYGKDGVIACGRRGMAEHSRVGCGRPHRPIADEAPRAGDSAGGPGAGVLARRWRPISAGTRRWRPRGALRRGGRRCIWPSGGPVTPSPGRSESRPPCRSPIQTVVARTRSWLSGRRATCSWLGRRRRARPSGRAVSRSVGRRRRRSAWARSPTTGRSASRSAREAAPPSHGSLRRVTGVVPATAPGPCATACQQAAAMAASRLGG